MTKDISKAVLERADGSKSDICLIYRKQQASYFSIEKVFNSVFEQLKTKINIRLAYLPYQRVMPWNIWKNLRYVRHIPADLYHVTGDVHYAVLSLPRKKSILTIHDCVFLQNTSGVKRWLLKCFYLKWPVSHCKKITTISEKSKEDIVRYTGCAPDKIIVIPNPVGDSFYNKEKIFNESNPTLLFIGSTPNKNLERIIEAIRSVSCHLVIVGNLNDQQTQLLQSEKISFTQMEGLSEQALADAYAECDIVLFPSTYEGFGLPIIEGQKSGRPVITSNISPMKEVAGEGACLVDPLDIASIKAGVIKVIHDYKYRRDIIEKGLENVRHFEPAFIAGQYLQMYKNILNRMRN